MLTPRIPEVLLEASKDPSLLGDYLLSPPSEWVQPYDPEDFDWPAFDRDFDGKAQTKQGILSGAVRICNTGCEGYHVYVFRGPYAGTIWSDQRVPFGHLTKICGSVEEYIRRIREEGRDHIASY